MKLVNIHNKGKTIYLFTRDEKGNQVIRKDNSFYPFYFEPDEKGKYVGYDGTPLKKCFVNVPQEIKKQKSPFSHGGDIVFTKNYVVHKIDKLEKCAYKYFFLDIEVLTKELPDTLKAKYPISCISIYNSFNKEIKTWWLPNYKSEEKMLMDFCNYVKTETPDLILAWNSEFDYTYLHQRIKKFPEKISPINLGRWGTENCFYPAGISILDYLILFKKVIIKEPSYALDKIAQKYLNETSWGKEEFGVLNDTVRKKNINDVIRMVKLEKMFNILAYYDEVRLLSKCLWEDLIFNARIIEMLFLEEAKNNSTILPNKKDNEKVEYQGAIREALKTGLSTGIGKFDLTSAYPSMIYNFCLDTQNISQKGININGITFKQDKNALLPIVIKKILTLKDNLKILKKTNPSKENDLKYSAIKGIVNSCYGVLALQFFRLYDSRIALTTTFLVRDLLMYSIQEVEKLGYKVIYYDTDAIFIDTTEDVTELLNGLVQKWAKEKYGKDGIELNFEYEGYFDKIFILAACHYFGYVHGKKEPEIKGMEIKRNSSTKYESWFQRTLIDKILDGITQKEIITWIISEQERIKTLPITDIAFPCKITKEYKNVPIFKRAYENSKKKFGLSVTKGELFYYIFTKVLGKDERGKKINVLAFLDPNQINKEDIDYNEIIRRNILLKVDSIFEVMKWDKSSLTNTNQLKLF